MKHNYQLSDRPQYLLGRQVEKTGSVGELQSGKEVDYRVLGNRLLVRVLRGTLPIKAIKSLKSNAG